MEMEESVVVIQSCAKRTAKCFQIKCRFGFLEKDMVGTIKLRARLWNSTFVQVSGGGAWSLGCDSTGELRLPDPDYWQQYQSVNRLYDTLRLYELCIRRGF